MTETMARPRPKSSRATLVYAFTVMMGLASLVPLTRLLEDFPRADFTVRNNTLWAVTLVVRTGPDSIMPVMTIDAESSREATEVIVPGETWRFVWRFAGEDVGTSTVADDDLQRDGFVLTVPDEVAEELRARSAPPTP